MEFWLPPPPVPVTSGDAGGLGAYVSGDTAGAESFRAVVERLVKIIESAKTDG
jgi:hypothetical protein